MDECSIHQRVIRLHSSAHHSTLHPSAHHSTLHPVSSLVCPVQSTRGILITTLIPEQWHCIHSIPSSRDVLCLLLILAQPGEEAWLSTGTLTGSWTGSTLSLLLSLWQALGVIHPAAEAAAAAALQRPVIQTLSRKLFRSLPSSYFTSLDSVSVCNCRLQGLYTPRGKTEHDCLLGH